MRTSTNSVSSHGAMFVGHFPSAAKHACHSAYNSHACNSIWLDVCFVTLITVHETRGQMQQGFRILLKHTNAYCNTWSTAARYKDFLHANACMLCDAMCYCIQLHQLTINQPINHMLDAGWRCRLGGCVSWTCQFCSGQLTTTAFCTQSQAFHMLASSDSTSKCSL